MDSYIFVITHTIVLHELLMDGLVLEQNGLCHGSDHSPNSYRGRRSRGARLAGALWHRKTFHVSPRVLRLSPVSITPPLLHIDSVFT